MGNLDAIMSTPGLDGVYVGPSDLAFDHGMPPELDSENPLLLSLLDKVLTLAKQHGVAVAMHCATPAYARKMVDRGFDMVTFGSDVGFMLAANQGAMTAFTGSAATKKSSGY